MFGNSVANPANRLLVYPADEKLGAGAGAHLFRGRARARRLCVTYGAAPDFAPDDSNPVFDAGDRLRTAERRFRQLAASAGDLVTLHGPDRTLIGSWGNGKLSMVV